MPTTFYPPAAAAWGIDLSRLVILQPTNAADALWALDQALRCRGVGAAIAECGRLDVRDFRRLQLAAEAGGTLGLLLRPDRLRGQPTWADVQWHIHPLPLGEGWSEGFQNRRSQRRNACQLIHPHPNPLPQGEGTSSTWRLRVELLRCRGAAGGQSVVLELEESTGIWREATDEAPHPLPVVAELADSAPAWGA